MSDTGATQPQADSRPQSGRRVSRCDRRGLSRALTALERGGASAAALFGEIEADLTGIPVLGVTGPPGAGKSTLVNALTVQLRECGWHVAILAIDPSSPVSGGAILGDRLRMTTAADDAGVMVRSLSASGHIGGLSPAAVRMIDGFDAAGFDVVIVETVGTGQNEIDVARIADVRLVVAAPGLGDDIQAMKSGLLEIADVLAVNKSDRPGAEQTRQQLTGALSLRASDHTARANKHTLDPAGPNDVAVLAVSAANGSGMVALAETLSQRLATVGRDTSVRERRNARARYLLTKAVTRAIEARIGNGGSAAIDDLAHMFAQGRIDAAEALKQLKV